MYFCCQWANYFFIAWMPVYLQEGRGFSENAMKLGILETGRPPRSLQPQFGD